AALASEVPIDAAIVAGDAGDVTADLLFERGRPGHELEAKAVVDHGEAAGGERESLAIGTGNILAAGGVLERHAGLSRELLGEAVQFAPAQRVEQPTREDDTATLPLGVTLADQMLRAFVQSLTDLGAEA